MIADYIEQHDNLDNECAERNELRGSQLHVITPSERLRRIKEAPSCLLGKDEGLTAYRVLLWQRLLAYDYTVNTIICQTIFLAMRPYSASCICADVKLVPRSGAVPPRFIVGGLVALG